MSSAINHQPFADTHKAQEKFVALQPVKSPSIYPLNPDAPTFNPVTMTCTAYEDTQELDYQRDSFLATSIANAMDRNRLPVPTPKPFSGDPMEYISFKRSFKTLIEKKAISAEETIYYLQQYPQGDAKQAVARCFKNPIITKHGKHWRNVSATPSEFRNHSEGSLKIGPSWTSKTAHVTDHIRQYYTENLKLAHQLSSPRQATKLKPNRRPMHWALVQDHRIQQTLFQYGSPQRKIPKLKS